MTFGIDETSLDVGDEIEAVRRTVGIAVAMEAAFGATQAHSTLDVNDNRDPPTSRSAPHVDKKLSNTSRNNDDKYRAEPLGLSE